MNEQQQKDPEDMDPFERAVYEIDRIEVVPERHLSVQMDLDVRNAIRAAQQSGGTASVTVKIVVKRKGEMVEITGTSTAKLPKPAAGTVRMFADDLGDLFNHNPNHVKGALPGVNVETPKRRRPEQPPLERPVNATSPSKKGKE